MLFNLILIIHIAGGTLALLGVPVAPHGTYGNKIHRAAGKMFITGMTAVFITAMYMGIVHPNLFYS
jgi:uncharacterized membrane protein